MGGKKRGGGILNIGSILISILHYIKLSLYSLIYNTCWHKLACLFFSAIRILVNYVFLPGMRLMGLKPSFIKRDENRAGATGGQVQSQSEAGPRGIQGGISLQRDYVVLNTTPSSHLPYMDHTSASTDLHPRSARFFTYWPPKHI